jgi:hypothetical protein
MADVTAKPRNGQFQPWASHLKVEELAGPHWVVRSEC